MGRNRIRYDIKDAPGYTYHTTDFKVFNRWGDELTEYVENGEIYVRIKCAGHFVKKHKLSLIAKTAIKPPPREKCYWCNERITHHAELVDGHLGWVADEHDTCLETDMIRNGRRQSSGCTGIPRARFSDRQPISYRKTNK